MEPDPLLRRVECTAIGLCGAMAVAALIVARGSPWPGGWRFWPADCWSARVTGCSRPGVSNLSAAIAPTEARAPARRAWRIVLSLAGRYALLGLMAYVMIARLRLHPLGLLAGASSIVAAVTVEAVRLLVKKP